MPAVCPLLLVEGVGAGRREVAHLLDGMVWVQSDLSEMQRRNRSRIGRAGGASTVQGLNEWMAAEDFFVAAQRTWEHADVIIAGTPESPHDPTTEALVAANALL